MLNLRIMKQTNRIFSLKLIDKKITGNPLGNSKQFFNKYLKLKEQ